MEAEVLEGVDRAARVPPEREPLLEKRRRMGGGPDVGRVRHRVPAPAEGGQALTSEHQGPLTPQRKVGEEAREVVGPGPPRSGSTPGRLPAGVARSGAEVRRLPGHHHPLRRPLARRRLHVVHDRVVLDARRQPGVPGEVAEHRLEVHVAVRDVEDHDPARRELVEVEPQRLVRDQVERRARPSCRRRG